MDYYDTHLLVEQVFGINFTQNLISPNLVHKYGNYREIMQKVQLVEFK